MGGKNLKTHNILQREKKVGVQETLPFGTCPPKAELLSSWTTSLVSVGRSLCGAALRCGRVSVADRGENWRWARYVRYIGGTCACRICWWACVRGVDGVGM